jgi:predicted alpha/beta-hydrolase family hydrolase
MARPLFLFAPGAGAPSSHPWIQHWAAMLREIGEVETFDYDYMRERRKRPDALPVLVSAHRAALLRARETHDRPAVLIGKSMGSRVGCHLSLDTAVAAVVCLGYPLCGGGDPTKLRDKVLREMTTPILFVQGTRDSLCPLELLTDVRRDMRAPNELHVVEEGDHSLMVTKRQLKLAEETQETVDARILSTIAGFVTRHVAA